MSYHGGDTTRRVWGLPDIERLFSDTPDNFIVTYDAYLHDDLPTKPANAEAAQGWAGPYLDEEVPQDPWGHPYQYAPQASSNNPFTLYSYGADGKPGGEGQDADIGYVPGNATAN